MRKWFIRFAETEGDRILYIFITLAIGSSLAIVGHFTDNRELFGAGAGLISAVGGLTLNRSRGTHEDADGKKLTS